MTRIVKARPTAISVIKTNIDLAKAVSDARPDLTWLQCLKIADAITTEGRNPNENLDGQEIPHS